MLGVLYKREMCVPLCVRYTRSDMLGVRQYRRAASVADVPVGGVPSGHRSCLQRRDTPPPGAPAPPDWYHASVLERVAKRQFVPGRCGCQQSSPPLKAGLKRSTHSITSGVVCRSPCR